MAANMDVIEQTDLDDVFSLQFVQWTVPQFCFRVLENVVRCLQGSIDEQLSMQCFELIDQVASLLADSVIPAALWEDTSLPAHELVNIISCSYIEERHQLTNEFSVSDYIFTCLQCFSAVG